MIRAPRSVLLGVFPVLLLGACGLGQTDPQEADVPDRPIEEVQEAHTPAWMEIEGVVGSGIGLCDDEEPCIRVFLARRSSEAEAAIPERVEGWPVELVVTGEVRPRMPPDTGDRASPGGPAAPDADR